MAKAGAQAAKRLRRSHVEHHVEFRGLLDWHISRLLTLDDSVHI